jgi:hypothetical protein
MVTRKMMRILLPEATCEFDFPLLLCAQFVAVHLVNSIRNSCSSSTLRDF